MNKKELINTMRQLRDSEIDKIQKENKLLNVLNVKYLGKVDLNGNQQEISKEDIYLIIDQLQNKEGDIIQVERYYNGKGEFLGGNNKSDKFDYILLNEKLSNNIDLKIKLQQLDKKGLLQLKDVEKEELSIISKELGIEEEKIEKIAEIDTSKTVEDRKKGKEDNAIDDKEIKTYIDTNEKVTTRETIASLLKVQDKGYSKIAIVYSNKSQESNNTTRYSFVGIKPDGTVEKINSLKQRYGKKPTKNVVSINRNGTEVKEKQVQSIYQIEGEDENQLGVRIGTTGTIEASLIRTPRQENQEAISIPIETTSVLNKTTKEPMRLMDRQKNYSVKEEIERTKEHEELDCEEKITIRDIDDNPNNNTHEHVSEENIKFFIDEIMKDDMIEETFTRREVEERIKRGIELKEKDKTILQSIEDIKMGLQEDASHIKTHKQE